MAERHAARRGVLMTWHLGPLLAFDTETTGVDVHTDRIVSACVARVDGSRGVSDIRLWTVNPGVPIPPAATAVHGLTDEDAAAGHTAPDAVDSIAAALAEALAEGIPVVGWNVVYDLSLLAAELRRYELPSLEQRLGREVLPVIDGLLLDKQVDRYRRGSRRLVDVARHYGIDLSEEDAHGAEADALAAARVVWRIAQRHPALASLTLLELHELQVQWAASQAESFRQYLQAQGKPCDDVDGVWPCKPARAEVAA